MKRNELWIKRLITWILLKFCVIFRILQDLNLEFDGLNTEYKDLEIALAQTELKGSERRIQMGRKREVKHGIKRLEKLMKTVANTQTALQLLFSEMPHVEAVILILGGSPGRPRHVYEVSFSHGQGVRSDPSDFTRTRVAEGISRKVIRTLVSKGAGSDTYADYQIEILYNVRQSFLFQVNGGELVHHHCSDYAVLFIVPMRLRIKCKNQGRGAHAQKCDHQSADLNNMSDSTSDDYIWFQCRHVIKGLACKSTPEE
nr:hypothetical protein [Tanacetum cinerariifolium]